jgi:hypothetical protein
MKFKVGDKVRIIDGGGRGIEGVIDEIDIDDPIMPYHIKTRGGGYWWKEENSLSGLNTPQKDTNPKDAGGKKQTLEQFEKGATRTVCDDKLSYVKALSPIVLRRYVQYLANHRKQVDGTMREFDNWKRGIPVERYLDGLGRHFMTLWLVMDGFEIYDDLGQKDIEDVLCAIIFNSMGMLHEIRKGYRGCLNKEKK